MLLTFLRQRVKSMRGVPREEVAAASFLLIEAAALGSNGGLDAVSLPNEEVPPENLAEAVHHFVKLFIPHVQERVDSESELSYFSSSEISDPIRLKQLLQTAQLSGAHRVGGGRRQRRHHRLQQPIGRRETGPGVPLEQARWEGIRIHSLQVDPVSNYQIETLFVSLYYYNWRFVVGEKAGF